MQNLKYIKFSLSGFYNVKLNNNQKRKVNHNIINNVFIEEDLKSVTLELNDDINFEEHKDEIYKYFSHIYFNIISKTGADIDKPKFFLEIIKNDNESLVNENIVIKEECNLSRSYEAFDIYNMVIESTTALDKHELLYHRIFSTLENPNLIIQFMNLYQMLMELLSKGKRKVEQKNVVDYFKTNKYRFITFEETRRTGKQYKEDSITYLRNQIGHCEDTNDINLYKQLGTSITCHTINDIITVLNDVIVKL